MAQSKSFKEFCQEFQMNVEAQRAELGEGMRKSFVFTMTGMVPDEESDNVQLLYLDERFGSRRVGVDGYAYNDVEKTLVLIIADWNNFAFGDTLTKTEAETSFKRLRSFFELSKKGRLQDPSSGILEWSSPEYGLADTIQTECIERVRMLLFTDRQISVKLKELENIPMGDVCVEEDIWGLERLYQHYRSGLDHEPLQIEFDDVPIALKLATQGDGFKSYLGVMPAKKLADMYRRHGGRLLEGNVRSFLTLKSSVNRDIRGTILREPEHFFIYNNGIAVTAQDLVFNSHGEMVRATDFQIINGGQTTASLAQAVHRDAADVSKIQVALKLTEISRHLDPEKARSLIRNISRYSNNQNKVSGADFSSNHEFHILMEHMAERIVAPPAPRKLHGAYWFYERNRGSYMQCQMFMSQAQKNAFTQKTDKKHVVKKEDLARVRLIWKLYPHIVSKGASHLFTFFMNQLDEDWETKKQNGYYGDDYFRDSISLIIMYNELRDLIKDQSWYTKGYLANIVAYGLSAFFWLFGVQRKGIEFDFEQIWNKQALPENLKDTLLYISRICKDCLTAEDRGKENVTEWAKMEACWKSVKRAFEANGYKLPEISDNWCRSAENRKEIREKAKANAKVDIAVNLLSAGLEYKYWNEAFQFHRSCPGVLTTGQARALGRCRLLPKVLPTEREVRIAFESLVLLRQEGFKH